MAATVVDREPAAPAEEERALLAEVYRALHREPAARPQLLLDPHGEAIQLPPSLLRVLKQVALALLQGDAVAIYPVHKELTTQQAADLLNVSRQYLVRLLEEGKIPYTKTGTHRRIRFSDLMAYKAQRDAERRRQLDELAQLSQDLGLYH
jgi:excisionase family DNA binding protein